MHTITMEDYYELLGIGPEASLAEINAAYAKKLNFFRRKMRSEERPPVEELDAMRKAFRVLGDAEKRRLYDEERAMRAAPPPVMAHDAPTVMEMLDPQATVMVDHEVLVSGKGPSAMTFSFVGNGGEYFRIWIVNLLLSLLTLGVYSAWAKVRREQYFHRNLLLAGSGFDYHAQPRSILKGRAVVFGVLMVLSMAQSISPLVHGLATLCLLPLIPWLAIRAFRFRAYNTSYRGLRFSFDASYVQALVVFAGYGLLTLITLGLAFPLFYRQLRKFILDHLRFGESRFACTVGVGAIYRIFVFPVLVGLLAVAALAILLISFSGKGQAGGWMAMAGVAVLAFPLMLLLAQALIVPYIGARTANAVWNTTRLGRHGFDSYVPVAGFIALTATNWLLILLTLGLFMPWAKVRTARYRAEHLSMLVDGDLEDFVGAEILAASALGDEAAEMMDLDIGL